LLATCLRILGALGPASVYNDGDGDDGDGSDEDDDYDDDVSLCSSCSALPGFASSTRNQHLNHKPRTFRLKLQDHAARFASTPRGGVRNLPATADDEVKEGDAAVAARPLPTSESNAPDRPTEARRHRPDPFSKAPPEGCDPPDPFPKAPPAGAVGLRRAGIDHAGFRRVGPYSKDTPPYGPPETLVPWPACAPPPRRRTEPALHMQDAMTASAHGWH